MKVLAINGSPNENGNTYFAISVELQELEKEGIETETLTVGNKDVRGCIASVRAYLKAIADAF